jgi:hypothetical protein
MSFPKKAVLGILIAGSILYGLDRCNSKLSLQINSIEMVNKLAVKSLVDTFNIKLNKEDSLIFSRYLKEFTADSHVKKSIYDIQKIAKDTNLLAIYNKDMGSMSIHRDRILQQISNSMTDKLIMRQTKLMDSLNRELSIRLEKYPEYKKFKEHWNKHASNADYSKIYSKNFMIKDTIKRDTIIKKDTIKKKLFIRNRLPK